jgi:protoheme IX farnesyltransferase
MIGWAAVTGGVSAESLLMFLVIFLWTPPHFWALALFAHEDYRAADVPMMPNAAGHAATRCQIFGYSLLMAGAALALAFTSIGGPVYLAAALALNGAFVWRAAGMIGRDDAAAQADRFGAEKRLFGVSIGYLFALFGVLAAQAALGGAPASWPVLF